MSCLPGPTPVCVEPRVTDCSEIISLATYTLFTVASCFTKLSILATFYRLLGPSDRRMKIFVRLFAGVIAFQSTVFCIALFVQCRYEPSVPAAPCPPPLLTSRPRPLSDFWNIFASPRHCFNQARHLLIAGSINTCTDFLVVFLPITTIIGLQLPRRQRVMVIALFSFGFLACAAGIVRTYITWVMTVSYDITWHAWSVVISSATELYIGIICASVPATKPFFVTYLPGKFDSQRRHPSKSSGITGNSDPASTVARRCASKSGLLICEEEEALRSPTTSPISLPYGVSMDPLVARPPPSVCSSSPSKRRNSGSPSWRITWPLPRGDRPAEQRDDEFRSITSLEEGRAVRDHV